MTARDKRTSPRVQPFVMRCRLLLAGRTAIGYLTDLSVRGARVHTQDQPPAAGTRLEIEVRFRHASRHSRLDAEVKWSRVADDGRGYSLGVRFLELGRDERAMLDQVVEEFHAQAARID